MLRQIMAQPLTLKQVAMAKISANINNNKANGSTGGNGSTNMKRARRVHKEA